MQEAGPVSEAGPVDEATPVSEAEPVDEATPWGTGLTVSAFVAAFVAAAIVVLSLGMIRLHPLVSIGLNVIAVGGLAPTLWGWRRIPVRRWFVLGVGVGVAIGWISLLAFALR